MAFLSLSLSRNTTHTHIHNNYMTSEVVAVSGGVDSTSLCLLLDRWIKESVPQRRIELRAVTVDHDLRPESATEALQVHSFLSSRGINHAILKIDWKKSRVERRTGEEIRERRYEEISRYARGVVKNGEYILTAHHEDDQRETFLHRVGFDSSLYGLRGISPISILSPSSPHSSSPIFLTRPLLSFSKHRLWRVCEEFEQKFVEDPSNSVLDKPRNRIRHGLSSLLQNEPNTNIPRDILAMVSFFQNTAVKIRLQGKQLVESSMRFDRELGFVVINQKSFVSAFVGAAMARTSAEYAVSIAMGFIQGRRLRSYSTSSCQKVVSRLMGESPPTPLGSGGYLLVFDGGHPGREEGGQFIMCRESTLLQKQHTHRRLPIVPDGKEVILDDRFVLNLTFDIPSTTENEKHKSFSLYVQTISRVRLSDSDRKRMKQYLSRISSAAVRRRVMETLPVVVDGMGNVLCIPHLCATFWYQRMSHPPPSLDSSSILQNQTRLLLRCNVQYAPWYFGFDEMM
eukprot:TRINITY_DN2588_c0_g1_i1.p1 TRINITY_DN2588_c0_g1~~TRINITY_DN2588_c0_g1_i1.p1  ORF type:complete len:512 (-),score=78.90 TRINITY_DN2588_c0_g1_i1:38-1573(-)